MNKNIQIKELSFKDLYITFLKNKFIICIFFLLMMFSSFYYSTNTMVPIKTFNADFYSDIINLTYSPPYINRDQVSGVEYTHKEIIINLYLRLHRETDFKLICQEFKVNPQNLISRISCMRTTTLDFKKFKNKLLTNLDKVFEDFIDVYRKTSNPSVIEPLIDKKKLISNSQGIVFNEKSSNYKLIFFNLFSFLLSILLTFTFLIIKSK